MTNRDKFIEKAKQVHADENLDYSKVEYKNNRTPVLIIDHDLDDDGNEYGEFWQSPWNHLKGQCHPRKRGKRISASKSSKQEEVIERFKKVHAGENLDYSQVKYVNMHTKVKIISHDLRPDGTEYGEFWQEPVVHLKGCTHPEIGKRKQISSQTYTTEQFIEKAKEVHANDDYSYDFVDYKKSKTKVLITCNKIGSNGKPHGNFWTSPDLFLMGKGCPKCGNHLSIAEDILFEELSKKIGAENIIRRDKSILCGKEIDLYIPKNKVGIEFDGLRWHSEEFKDGHDYHLKKTIECAEKGVALLHIFEDEFLKNRKIVIDKILNILGQNGQKPKIYGRNTLVSEITTGNAKVFLNKYHIQGFVGSTVYLGAFHDGKLIAVMSFLKTGEGSWTLTRFCTDIAFSCPGVASKMFKHFVRSYSPMIVTTFLDRRWCKSEMNNVYTALGFLNDGMLKPNYSYTDGHGNRFHKFGFRKQILHKKYGFPLSMTEKEMTEKLGYKRIWDCGLIRYVWKIDQ